MSKDEKKFYTMQEVADELGVTRLTVYRWIESGKLKAFKVGGRWKITAEMMETLKTKGTG